MIVNRRSLRGNSRVKYFTAWLAAGLTVQVDVSIAPNWNPLLLSVTCSSLKQCSHVWVYVYLAVHIFVSNLVQLKFFSSIVLKTDVSMWAYRYWNVFDLVACDHLHRNSKIFLKIPKKPVHDFQPILYLKLICHKTDIWNFCITHYF